MANAATSQLKYEAGRGLVVAARIGYAAKGIVYSVLGVLALMFVFGEGGGLTDGKGALRRIASLPFGDGLLWITAIGLACYALWCAVCAAMDPWRLYKSQRRMGKRMGYALGFVWNGSLAVYAGQLARGAGQSDTDTKTYVARLLELPWGELLVALVGALTVCFGLYQVYKAIANRLGDELSSVELRGEARQALVRVARIGVGARGMVFPVIGLSLIIAALRSEPQEAQDFGEALHELASRPFGEVMLGFIAAGLLAYGIYQLCVARFGGVPTPR